MTMGSAGTPLAGDENNLEADNHFRFVSVHNPYAAKDPESRCQVRSHAVKQALKAKRKLQQETNNNFRVVRPLRETQLARSLVSATLPLSPSTHDPFDMLVVDSSRLKSLLSYRAARQAAEPVFSVRDEVVFQTFQSVFRTDVNDPALSNAVMLTFAFGVTGGSINQECLGYLNRATKSIYERMSSPDKAASVTIIGAILLLAGVEARLGMRSQVQLHMEAVRQLLGVCGKRHIYLNDGIKRAIFWQDLNCSVMTDSHRIFDHTTFAELQWGRDPFSPGFYVLSAGFKTRSHLLSTELIEVLEDLHALQCIRNSPGFVCKDTTEMMRVDNHQASIQSRLVGLPKISLFSECCHLAAYISACQLCCKVWRASTIPYHVSLKLLSKLQQADEGGVWDGHPDLLIWLLYMGGAFVPAGPTRSSYAVLLKKHQALQFGDLYSSWLEMLGILKQFIWSEKAFAAQMKEFWEESSI